MLYVMFEAIETEENAIYEQKSTILDGRRRRRRRRVVVVVGRMWK